MKIFRFGLSVLLGVVLFPPDARSQALTSLQSVRVGYNTAKTRLNPQGELKTQIDEVDRQIAEATRVGNTGEVRRLLAKGQSLLNGRPWTPELDFSNSIVLRTSQVVADSAKPYGARIEQIYRPQTELSRSLTTHVTLRSRPAAGGRGGAPATTQMIKDFGTLDSVSRDLRESPFELDLDMSGVADGTYQLAAEVLDGTRSLGTATLTISLRKGLDDLIARLEADAKKAPESVRADILFPVDRMRQVNRGRLELRTFNPERDFAGALEVATAARSGKNPFATRTGDFKRHYLLTSANEIMPYRIYVPKGYTASRTWPLIVALHGLGGTEDSFFEGYGGTMTKLAEQHGYLVAAPLGYRVDGSYGWGTGNPPADPGTRRVQERSEQDVMQVLQLMKQQYKIDDNRVYLMGHSMGAIGSWKIAPKYPDLFAAVGPIAGSGSPDSLERYRHVPHIIVHGDADPTVNVRGSRTMVERMKQLGIEHKYIEVPGGGHSDIAQPNLPAMFEFFNAHTRKPTRGTP
jgi:poly(3-hydroxybutyrate) depolymerase